MIHQPKLPWMDTPIVDYDPMALREYESLIEKGIIRENHVNRIFKEERGEDGSRNGKIDAIYYETSIEFIIPMHNFMDSVALPHLYRMRQYHSGDKPIKSDKATRALMAPILVKYIAHSYMFKFIKDRDERNT